MATLFDELPEKARDAVSRFERWHADNPHVYDLYQRFSVEAKESGRTRFSADAILHRIRWYVLVETRGEFKVNDVASAFYARMMIRDNPVFADFFELRTSAADEWIRNHPMRSNKSVEQKCLELAGVMAPDPSGEKKQLNREEYAFQDVIYKTAKLYGWKVVWFRPVRVQRQNGEVYYETPVGGDGTGWPDMILCHPKAGRFVVAEIKTDTGTVRPEQRDWIDWLTAAGVEAVVWRPRAWSEIVAVLEFPRSGIPALK